jgi:hypothetical protein
MPDVGLKGIRTGGMVALTTSKLHVMIGLKQQHA